MTYGTYTIVPDAGPITNDTVVPRGAVATYTCDAGTEYSDEQLVKTTECGFGGLWDPDLPNEDPCECTLALM